jgi:hypothetical protein
MAGDAFYSSVSLLLHADGADASTVFTDSGPLALTPNSVGGSIAIATAQSKFGGSSLNCRRTGELIYNSAGFAFGTGDFTIEAWLYFNSASGSLQYGPLQIATAAGYSTATNNNIAVFSNTGDKWAVIGPAGLKSSTLTITTGAWHHFAICRASGSVGVYVGGSPILTYTDNYNYTGTGAVIGGYYSTAYRFDGYIDDLRVTKGVCRYAGAFTPPNAPHPDQGYVLSGVIRDDTGAPCARTVRAYDRATGALLGSTTSDVSTGAYTLNVGDAEVQRIVLDDSGGTLYNDIIDRVIPA